MRAGTAIPTVKQLVATMNEARELTRTVPGHLAAEEARFLALAAAASPAEGVVLEIGSLKGKSTIALAHASAKHERGSVVAVDPHTSPAETDAPLGEQRSSYEDFMRNLRRAGVAGAVEVHRAYSYELAESWTRPIRLLWIDGDHTYAGTSTDLSLYLPFVAPGGIVAMHDVMHGYEGPDRVFFEEVLSSDLFGAAGVCRSVGWAQYLPASGGTSPGAASRARLARRMRGLARMLRDGARLRGLRRIEYKVRRARVPHGAVDAGKWLRALA